MTCIRPNRSPLSFFLAFYTCILYELRLTTLNKRIYDDDGDDDLPRKVFGGRMLLAVTNA